MHPIHTPFTRYIHPTIATTTTTITTISITTTTVYCSSHLSTPQACLASFRGLSSPDAMRVSVALLLLGLFVLTVYYIGQLLL
jgi:hypothetical protein